MRTPSAVRAPQPPPEPPTTHPATVPVSPAHLAWLRSEVGAWQHEGLLDARQAHAIVGRYRPTRTAGLSRLLLVLGAAFVGLGLIWLVAANLDALSPLARFGLVATLWAGTTAGAELLATRRAHGGPVPSPVVHAGRTLAALLLGAVVFQAAQSLQVPAYEPRLVGVWALGALLHGYVVRAVGPVTVGVVAGYAWLVWAAAWEEPTTLGVLLLLCAAGVASLAVAVLHDGRGRAAGADDLAAPWRLAGLVTLLGALFTAALPFVHGDALTWTPRLVGTVAAAAVLAVGAAVTSVADGGLLRAAEPLGGLLVTSLTMLLVVWDAGDAAVDVSAADWAHAVVAVVGYLLVCTAVAALGVVRDRSDLPALALVALVLFTTVQGFAVFARIIDGAWLFLAVGLLLAATGWLADRGRRHLARSLAEADTRAPATTEQEDHR